MRIVRALLMLICATTLLYAADNQISVDDPLCREVLNMATRYQSGSRPAGGTMARSELARILSNTIDQILCRCDKQGVSESTRADMKLLLQLEKSLSEELAAVPGYKSRRDRVLALLAPPEELGFLVKAGIDGFARGEGYRNLSLESYEYTPGHGQGWGVARLKPFVYWHPTDYLDLHLEGQFYGYEAPFRDHSLSSLYQGFVLAKVPGVEGVSVKVGRQEITYGSAFMLGSDSFFDGQSYDGATLTLGPFTGATLDLFTGRYAEQFSDGLEGTLTGGYLTTQFSEGNALELYAFRDSGGYEGERFTGEHRDSYGLRGTATAGPVSVEIEPVYQGGKLDELGSGERQRIEAFGGHGDLTVTLPVAEERNITLIAGYAVGSGSKQAVDGVSSRRQFAMPLTDSSLAGDMSVIGDLGSFALANPNDLDLITGEPIYYNASGVSAVSAGLGIDLLPGVNLTGTGRAFRARYTTNDVSHELGQEVDASLTWTSSDNLSLVLGYGHFFTGGFFREVAGDNSDIDYGYLMLQFNLARIWPKKS